MAPVEVRVTKTQTRIDREGSWGARVTSLAGSWGYWSCGKRVEVGSDRSAAEVAARVYVEGAASNTHP